VMSPALGLTVIFDAETYLPYIIRSVEDNALFGFSNRDLQVYNYTNVDGVKFPLRFTTTYQNAVTEDFKVTDIMFNPQLPPNLFDGLPANEVNGNPAAPAAQDNYTNAFLGEWTDNMLYTGQYTGTLSQLSATHPAPSLGKVWHLVFEDAPGYTQLITEFDDAVFVFDSPPHQSELVIQWVRQNLGKSITHLWVSALQKFARACVSTVLNTFSRHITTMTMPMGHRTTSILEQSLWYPKWQRNFGLVCLTFQSSHMSKLDSAIVKNSRSDRQLSEGKPFIYRDNTTQLRLVWHEHSGHAEDQGYAIVTAACPKAEDQVVVFEADTWNPGLTADGLDEYEARTWLDQALKDGLSINAM
jgi:hypothetical protein